MRVQLIRGFALHLFILLCSPLLAVTTDGAFNSIPSRFETTDLTVGSRGLGEICLSRSVMSDGTACNPAFLGELEDSLLLGRVFVGNGYSALSTANEFVNGTVSKDFLQKLFRENNVSSVELHVGLLFATKNFSAGFSPYRIQYVSEIHNPNFPVLAAHAALERSFVFSGGASLVGITPELKDFSAGAKLRLIERKFVHSSFSLLQLTTESANTLLPVHEQKAIFLDPYVGWHSAKTPWKPRLSLGVQNLGHISRSDDLFRQPTDLAFGVGIEPSVPMGTWRVGLDAVNLFHAEDLVSRFRLGTSYRLGILEPMAGINSKSFTTGLQFDVQIIQAGIVYEFIRSDIEGAAFQNRIVTEFAVKL